MYSEFATRLEEALKAKAIRNSPTVLANLFNSEFDGRSVTPHTARNWLLGKSLPTQDKLVLLAKILDTSSEHLRYGRHSEKTLAISNQDGTQTELTISQQQFVKNYLKLSIPKQKLVSDLVFELTELNMSTSSRLDLTQ
jgi:hypothetical protein